MSFRTRRVLFQTPLFMIFEYFLFKYLISLFSKASDYIIIMAVIILGLMQAGPMLFEEKKSTPIGRFFSTVFGICEWFLMMLLFYVIIFSILGLFINIPLAIKVFFLLLIILIGIYAYYNAHRIVVIEKELKLENIAKEYDIIQISDVHFGSVRHKQIISDITDTIDSISDKCDLVVISGDLTDGSCKVCEDDLIEFKKVDIPIIFTSGNHDYYPGIENVHKACKKAGIIVLENDTYKYENLNIYGLSYSFDDIEMPTRKELEEAIDDKMINIVNYHTPNGWNYLSEIGFDIQLSGHTHGGQFYPVTWLGNIVYEGHNMGLFKQKINDKTHYLHVTTGVGSMDVPIRWGTKSEIVILKIRNKI